MTSSSVLIVLIVSSLIGALTGMALNGITSIFVLGLVAGFLGVTGAAVVRNYVLGRFAKTGPEDYRVHRLVIVFSLFASIAGSLAAEDIGTSVLHLPPTLIGGFAGLLSSVLMVMLLTTYYMTPDNR